MSESAGGFLRSLALRQPKNRDLAVAVLWWHEAFGDGEGLTVQQISREVERAGYPKQNGTRLRRQLEEDRRTKKAGKGRFAVSVRARSELDREFRDVAAAPPIVSSDSILPVELFSSTRTYVERVVEQINASFDASLFDCTAIMCRRLLETLIIEAYERQVRADELLGADGHFKPLSTLIAHIESDPVFHLSREGLKGLKTFKKLGDQAAHNRRFLARRNDILRVRDGLRIAAEDLLHLAWPTGNGDEPK